MAKNKSESNDDIRYLGQNIDPDLQKKVDEYMQPDFGEVASEPVAGIPSPSTEVPEVASAPLLPTEKLPDLEAKIPPTSKRKIVVIGDEPLPGTALEVQPELVTPEVPPEAKPAKVIKKKSTKSVPKSAPPNAEAGVVELEPDAKLASLESAQPETFIEQGIDPVAKKSTPEFTKEAADDEGIDSKIRLSEDELNEVDPVQEPEPLEPEASDLDSAPEYNEEDTLESVDELPLDDGQISSAIEDIVSGEADAVLAVQDAEKEQASGDAVKIDSKKPKKARGNILKLILKTPLYRNILIVVILLILLAVAVIPGSRYFVLNNTGVRVSTSLVVKDESTGLPLKNVQLSVQGKIAKSDEKGVVKIDNIKLGKQKIILTKPGFAEAAKDYVLGWGSNPLGELKLKSVGTQYSFLLTDFISNKLVKLAEASYEEASATVNDKGEILLTVPKLDKDEIEIKIIAENYREEKIKVKTTQKNQQTVQMVPAKKHIFVSKRNGKLDLYKIDVDGKNEQVLLSATGIEKEDSLGIAVHPTKNKVAYVSTRENNRNKDGFLLSTLSLVDIGSGQVQKLTQSERIQLIDWTGDRLVYVKVTEGVSEGNKNRNRLISYDVESNQEKELASTNYFNDVVSVNGAIYYTPALYQVNGQVGLYKINADGTGKKTIFAKEVWNLFRTSYDKVSMSVGQDWYELNLENDAVAKIGGAPSVLKSRVYVPDFDKKKHLWIDERDGKSVLILYSVDSKKEQSLVSESGIKNPVRWLDPDHVVYRVADGKETADYVMSLSGGASRKIKDVTNTAGIDRWYYY